MSRTKIEWNSSSEKKPDSITPVLGLCTEYDLGIPLPVYHICWWDEDYKLWRDEQTKKVIDVSYWMEIPIAPITQ